MTLPLPRWYINANGPVDIVQRLRNRYLIRSAALFHSPKGTIEMLADGLGISHPGLVACYSPSRGIITAELAVKIEKLVGMDYMPRELIRPDMFIIPKKTEVTS